MEVDNIQELVNTRLSKYKYKQTIRQGKFKGKLMNQVVYNHIASHIPVMASGGINSLEKALVALEFADMVGASTPFVTEPDFVITLTDGREYDINLGFTHEKLDDLAIPERVFKDLVELMDIGCSLSDDTRLEISKLRD